MESENGTLISFETIIFRNSIFNVRSFPVGFDSEPLSTGPGPFAGISAKPGSNASFETTEPFPEPTERWHCPSGSMVWWKTWTRSGTADGCLLIGDDIDDPTVSFEFIPGWYLRGHQQTTFERVMTYITIPQRAQRIARSLFLLLVDKRQADTTRCERIDG